MDIRRFLCKKSEIIDEYDIKLWKSRLSSNQTQRSNVQAESYCTSIWFWHMNIDNALSAL